MCSVYLIVFACIYNNYICTFIYIEDLFIYSTGADSPEQGFGRSWPRVFGCALFLEQIGTLRLVGSIYREAAKES